ncbi:hypothetical protein R3P38DRAFT_2787753 [Favolaschia claudopus]|uniref:Uncharacterized protein n=1 Tax=Favolaschia claudopus TaxID=2862362 RepID=A0AAW0AMY2_9AGAR
MAPPNVVRGGSDVGWRRPQVVLSAHYVAQVPLYVRGNKVKLPGVDTGLSQTEGVPDDVQIAKGFELIDISTKLLRAGETNTYVLPALNIGLSFEIEVNSILQEIENARAGTPLERAVWNENRAALADSDFDEPLTIFCGMAKLSSRSGSSQKIHSRNRKAGKSKISDFKRERSEIPHGGWFRATTKPPDSLSEDSEASSTSDSSLASSTGFNSAFGLKIEKPFTYDEQSSSEMEDDGPLPRNLRGPHKNGVRANVG